MIMPTTRSLVDILPALDKKLLTFGSSTTITIIWLGLPSVAIGAFPLVGLVEGPLAVAADSLGESVVMGTSLMFPAEHTKMRKINGLSMVVAV